MALVNIFRGQAFSPSAVATLLVMLMSGSAAAQSISGSYDLYRAGDLGGKLVARMQVSGQQGPLFAVSGNSGSWRGRGQIQNGKGYYDWRFSDGRTGRTTIVVDGDGNLQGSVTGAGSKWTYVGRRLEGPIRLKQIAVECGSFSKPFADGVASYLNATNACAATQHCWVRVNKNSPPYQMVVKSGNTERIYVGVLANGSLIETGCNPAE